MTPYEALLHWVREREAIRQRKDGGAARPWTTDPILAKYRFCNVRREDDRVTVWVRKNIREPYAEHPALWFMLAITRWVNWPDTLLELLTNCGSNPADPRFSLDGFADVLKRREARGEKVFTGAYTINAPSKRGASKIEYVANEVLGAVWRQRDYIERVMTGQYGAASIARTHGCLTGYRGWGNFMAYQVCVDLRFTRYLRDAPDVAIWAAAGPGTIRGLNRIHNRRLEYTLEQGQARSEMRQLFESVPRETGVAMDFSDVPNILCEADKYLRVLNGEGEPRALYHQTAEAA